MFCGCPTDVRRRAQHPGLPDLPRPARRAAGRQRQGGRVRDPDRARAQLRDRRVVPVRAEELLLPGHAEELPDLAVRRADRLRRLDRRRASDGETFRIEIERAHMEEDTGKSLHVGGSTGRIHGADYSLVDYNRAGIPLIEIVTKPIAGAGEKAPAVARAYVAQLRDLLLGLGVSDVRMEQGSLRCDVNLSLAPAGSRRARHPHRDQERQLAALGRAGGALRDPAAGRDPRRGRDDHPGDPALARGHRRHHRRPREVRRRGLPLLPRARPGAGRAVPRVGRAAARHAARAAARAPGPAAGRLGLHRPRDARPVGAGALRAGRGRPSPPAPRRRPPASGGSASWPAAPTSRASSSPTSPSRPATSRASRRWSTRARSTTSSPARSSRACSPARARPTRSSPPAASRSSPTTAPSAPRSTRAIAANPDVADKIRDGKVAAAGALIGAVMKEMRGQADAGRVRELILERLS